MIGKGKERQPKRSAFRSMSLHSVFCSITWTSVQRRGRGGAQLRGWRVLGKEGECVGVSGGGLGART